MSKDALIITGWGKPNRATAAAAVARQYGVDNVEIYATSTGRFPNRLIELIESQEISAYAHVYILGIEIPQIFPALDNAVNQLPEGVRPVYFYARGFNDNKSNPSDFIKSKFETINGGALTNAVKEYTKSPIDIDDLIKLGNLLPNSPEKEKNGYQAILELIEAASYWHRLHRDDTHYINLIKHLARNEYSGIAESAEFSEMRADYRQFGPFEIRGNSAQTKALNETIKQYAKDKDCPVLICGPNGSGKEFVAQNLHHLSPRRVKKCVAFNCACVSPELILSQLFGHKKGSFTGADKDQPGLFRQVDGGTLFLDEIGELPLDAQAKLLRVLSTHKVTPLGGLDSDSYDVDFRLISATNRDLPEMIRQGKFREDLFHRISVLPLTIFPLKERKEDIREIAKNYWHFVKKKTPQLNDDEIKQLQNYDYPGNIRELLAILERACVLDKRDFSALIEEQKRFLNGYYLPDQESAPAQSPVPAAEPEAPEEDVGTNAKAVATLREYTKKYIKTVLKRCGGNYAQAAKMLDCSINTVKKHTK